MSIAKVIVELSLNKEFDYAIPAELQGQVQVGDKVNVPFGHRVSQGFVVGLAETSEHKTLKSILSRVGDKPLVTQPILDLARWIAGYYAAPIETAVRTVLPSAVRKKGASAKKMLYATLADSQPPPAEIALLRKRAPKQAKVLEQLVEYKEMYVSQLVKVAGVSAATVRSLADKGFLTISQQAMRRNPFADRDVLPTEQHVLMPEQRDALEVVNRSIDSLDPAVVLLFGVTGSGKTEIYLQGIQYALDQGKGAIVLVPEISLTPQTVYRFRSRFGEQVAVLHSSLSTGERHDEWHRIRNDEARIVVGPRSALFAPVRDLGLIVVDEEHEPSYKQEETPRYQARDMAVMRGHMEQCSVVLGSATPSLESMQNAVEGKYHICKLTHRVDHREMPEIRVIDMRKEAEREGRINVLSRDLLDAMRLRLEQSEQTILFLNRRGFATSLLCPSCGYVANCEMCSVSMTYHRTHNLLVCHICGAERKVPDRCPQPNCGDPEFKKTGLGTQRVEDVVQKVFPKARIQRMDADTTRGKDSHEYILEQFRMRKVDILIGTQMIAKGLHFPGVTLVGVINADMGLHLPDFRAGERTYQLLTQVAGRAGRGEVAGEVVVQTFTPFHPAVQAARRNDYEGFFDQEIEFRRELKYPPFSHLVCVTLTGPVEATIKYVGEVLVKRMDTILSKEVIVAGPTPAPLSKAKGRYRFQVMMRAPKVGQVTKPLLAVLDGYTLPRDVKCTVDVDATSLL